ncbi:MAG: glycosyl hydrolase [Bacteroidia bacterium]|nr:glycosyl hydrolase [Bacteroidia bacterium]
MKTKYCPLIAFYLLGTLLLMFGTCILANAQTALSSSSSKDISVAADVLSFDMFREPPAEFRGIRWGGFGLSNLTDSSAIKSIQSGAKSNSWGSTLLGPGGGPTTGLSEAYLKASRRTPSDKGVIYLSDEYFRIYKLAIEEGLKYNFPVSTLYDEWNYPSGIVGGQFYSKYPEDAAKSLEIVEKRITGPVVTELEIPSGIYVGAVIMNMDTYQRIDVSKSLSGNKIIRCKIPKGNWNLMGFYLNSEFRPNSQKGGFVDYLSKEAVAKYIALNFDPYYAHLKEYFGKVIKRTIYDEPAMHLSDGRMWTYGFNAAFEKKYHYSPMVYYPALWYDVGPETSAARNALYGFRAELFAENYIGQMAEWCAAHGIKLSGHLDQEEARNPVAINGDLMKAFEHQQIPGMDDIYFPGRSNVAYKIVASAGYNYDRPEFIVETYAAYRTMTQAIAMRVALDQLAMGVNMQLSVTGKTQAMDQFLGRSSYLLRGGRHVADIAVVYPIAALQSAYSFSGPLTSSRSGSSPDMYYAVEGGIVPPEIDYMNLGETLFRALRVDYTYIHPEVLVDRCTVDQKKLVLNNKVNHEEFRILILPGGDTFSADAAKKVLEFYRNGGTVIATSKLPAKSSEFNRDRELQETIKEIFGISSQSPMTAEITIAGDDFTSYFKNSNSSGGRGYFIPQPYPNILTAVLKEVTPVKDVDIQEPPMWPVKMGTAYDGALTYLHKVKGDRNIYFFSNSTDKPINTNVALRGDRNLEIWNPQTGEKQKAELVKSAIKGEAVTTVKLSLDPVSSVFFVED